jgi:hypothetical protein
MKNILICAIILMSVCSGSGYPLFPMRTGEYIFGLEINKPFWKTPSYLDMSFFSVSWFCYVEFKPSENLSIMFDFPMSSVSKNFVEGGYYSYGNDTTNISFGNPYFGIRIFSTQQAGYSMDMGFRVPFAQNSDMANLYGAAGNIERLDAFTSDLVPLYMVINYQTPGETVGKFDCGIGPYVYINTNSDLERDPLEVFLQYRFAGKLDQENTVLKLGVMGVAVLSEDVKWSLRTFDQLFFEGCYRIGRIIPGGYVKFLLDEYYRELYTFSVGIYLSVFVK